MRVLHVTRNLHVFTRDLHVFTRDLHVFTRDLHVFTRKTRNLPSTYTPVLYFLSYIQCRNLQEV